MATTGGRGGGGKTVKFTWHVRINLVPQLNFNISYSYAGNVLVRYSIGNPMIWFASFKALEIVLSSCASTIITSSWWVLNCSATDAIVWFCKLKCSDCCCGWTIILRNGSSAQNRLLGTRSCSFSSFLPPFWNCCTQRGSRAIEYLWTASAHLTPRIKWRIFLKEGTN